MVNKQSQVLISVNQMEKESCTKHSVYIRAHKIGDRNIIIKVCIHNLFEFVLITHDYYNYILILFIVIIKQAEYSRSEQIKGCKELTYSLAVKKPFEVATQFYTTLFEPLTKGFVNEPFIIMPHITCISPWAIKILSTSIEPVS